MKPPAFEVVIPPAVCEPATVTARNPVFTGAFDAAGERIPDDVSFPGEVNVYLSRYPDVEPGKPCPSCHRRIPHPKKPSSPKTSTKSYRVPVDEAEAHNDVVEQAARFVGCHERPHWMYQLVTLACALVLQDESLRGIANRKNPSDRRSISNERSQEVDGYRAQGHITGT